MHGKELRLVGVTGWPQRCGCSAAPAIEEIVGE